MPRKIHERRQPTQDELRAALTKGGRAAGDDVISVRANQLKSCMVSGCDADLASDVDAAGNGFIEVTGTEVLEAIGAGDGDNAEAGKPAKSGAAKTDGSARANVGGGDKRPGDKASAKSD